MSLAALRKRMTGQWVLLDTSVLIAYLNATDPVHAPATMLIDELLRVGFMRAVVSAVSVMELLVVPYRVS